jgi:hypothetical protein
MFAVPDATLTQASFYVPEDWRGPELKWFFPVHSAHQIISQLSPSFLRCMESLVQLSRADSIETEFKCHTCNNVTTVSTSGGPQDAIEHLEAYHKGQLDNTCSLETGYICTTPACSVILYTKHDALCHLHTHKETPLVLRNNIGAFAGTFPANWPLTVGKVDFTKGVALHYEMRDDPEAILRFHVYRTQRKNRNSCR